MGSVQVQRWPEMIDGEASMRLMEIERVRKSTRVEDRLKRPKRENRESYQAAMWQILFNVPS